MWQICRPCEFAGFCVSGVAISNFVISLPPCRVGCIATVAAADRVRSFPSLAQSEELFRFRNQNETRDRTIWRRNHVLELGNRTHPDNILLVSLLRFVENARLQCCLNQAGANDLVQAAFVVPEARSRLDLTYGGGDKGQRRPTVAISSGVLIHRW